MFRFQWQIVLFENRYDYNKTVITVDVGRRIRFPKDRCIVIPENMNEHFWPNFKKTIGELRELEFVKFTSCPTEVIEKILTTSLNIRILDVELIK